MMDSIKDYLHPKRFSTLAYVCVILHFMCGAILIAITMDSKSDDIWKSSVVQSTQLLRRTRHTWRKRVFQTTRTFTTRISDYLLSSC